MKAIASPDGDTDGSPPLVTRGAGCCAPSCEAAATRRTNADLGNMGVGRLRMPHATAQPQRRGGRPVWELFRTDDGRDIRADNSSAQNLCHYSPHDIGFVTPAREKRVKALPSFCGFDR